jgi:CheY-like chemotaxis protein
MTIRLAIIVALPRSNVATGSRPATRNAAPSAKGVGCTTIADGGDLACQAEREERRRSREDGTVLVANLVMRASTILLAEDDQDMRDIVQDLLEANGYDVIPARTGRQALEFLSMDAGAPPDIVILDMMMPIVTGWQVLETIRRDPELARVPVVVLTATSQDKPTGATAFLRKPFRIETLLEILRSLLVRPGRCVLAE